ncbi:glycosyltransferase family 2 protein [Calycomorphotria hydatis]|uniref:N-glycosyltransferase n=1 Tax=Calycomorphotria hydatis TaxID=2528027 RepID=A0A517TCS1_9PLAN|nr:glycosyltransferase family 2 protein [Calycomorphotria hydatis]QDT66166.1 N-glycosyltransferase [Calycomorphotria hydatis]
MSQPFAIIISIAVFAMCLPWLIAAVVFCAQGVSALISGFNARRLLQQCRLNSHGENSAPSVTILIPAHNEAGIISRTIHHLKTRLSPQDSILVVADNCTDETASLARAAGANVIERFDKQNRGKGFALNRGFDELQQNPPEVVFVLDADCRIGRFTLAESGRLAVNTQRPVQSLNLCRAVGNSATQAVSELGLRFKNLIRPAGLRALGLPCHLMGTGMALPWSVVESMPRLGSDLAEDMRLGVDLAVMQKHASFCPTARVVSGLPNSDGAFVSQRTRWEQGHLRTAAFAPQLLWNGLLKLRPSLFALGADLLIPPLSLFVLAGAGLFVLSGVSALITQQWLPFLVMLVAWCCFSLVIVLGWAAYCRRVVPASALLGIPWFIVRKIPIYLKFLTGRGEKKWVRTARTETMPANTSSVKQLTH